MAYIGGTTFFRRTSASTTTPASYETPLFPESDPERTPSSVGEVMYDLSKLSPSTTLMAAKAFVIATRLGVVVAVALT